MKKTLKKLLSKREIDLIEDKENGSELRLKTKVQLFRKLRNKYRDLAKRQKIAGKTHPDASLALGTAPDSRTVRKAEIFADAVTHYEQRLHEVQGGGEKTLSEAQPRSFHSSGLSTEAIAETAAHGSTSETAQEKQKRIRDENAA